MYVDDVGEVREGHATKVEQLSKLCMSILDLQEWTVDDRQAGRPWVGKPQM
jgi:hypothetical protein